MAVAGQALPLQDLMTYPDLRPRFEAFLAGLPEGKAVVLADGDVDGLGAACVVWDALGEREKAFLTPPKGRNAFGDETAALVSAQAPKSLFVLDLGVSPRVIAPGVPTLILDHHHPRGEPEGATVLSGYGLDPVPTSSLLAWKVAGTPANAWKANTGNQGDMGPSDAELDEERAGGTKRAFDMAKSLLNSAKRSSDPDRAVPAAFRILSVAHSPKEVLEATGPDADTLKQFSDEVKRELNEAKKNGPKFSKSEPLAMIRFSSPARVHPLIAQSWRGRLPKYAIMAVNDGYVPGRTQFSMRGNAGIDLLAILAKYGAQLGIDEPEYGHGHHSATGGSLPTETFERLIAAMGF
jgi:single-stranded-DNA-specific exonuclease